MSSIVSERSEISPILWDGEKLKLLDQRLLPRERKWVECRDSLSVARAIEDMVVRGAPAIGLTAAYGAVLAARESAQSSKIAWGKDFFHRVAVIRATRPTAVNLGWALDKMIETVSLSNLDQSLVTLENCAIGLHKADLAANKALGDFGAALIEPSSCILTHCNAGALATGGYGTALGVVRSAARRGLLDTVFATETRPWFQGSRLTAWELLEDGIPLTLLAESAAAWLMKSGKISWLIVGADRVAANGDVANKIGTYSLASLASQHSVKVMVVAPSSTIDLKTAKGELIPIEERNSRELTHINDLRVAAEGVDVFNPVFDVTPAELVSVLVTEMGSVPRPSAPAIENLLKNRVTGL
jgi:methylthioribose-1-phosphate isomerase